MDLQDGGREREHTTVLENETVAAMAMMMMMMMGMKRVDCRIVGRLNAMAEEEAAIVNFPLPRLLARLINFFDEMRGLR